MGNGTDGKGWEGVRKGGDVKGCDGKGGDDKGCECKGGD